MTKPIFKSLKQLENFLFTMATIVPPEQMPEFIVLDEASSDILTKAENSEDPDISEILFYYTKEDSLAIRFRSEYVKSLKRES